MFERRHRAALLSLLVVTAAVGPAAAAVAGGDDASAKAQGDAYAGTHVGFDATSTAIVDYRVNDEPVLERVAVQSRSKTESDAGLDVGIDLTAATDLVGAAVSVDARTETNASLRTDSGATLVAHDTDRGDLVVAAGESGQYVSIDVNDSASVENASDQRVVVTTENGTTGTFIVAGNGSVAATDGNVSASVDEDSRLVFRTYPDGRDAADERQEALIANGTATAEVYVLADENGENASDRRAEVVNYGGTTTVDVTESSNGTVEMTAERSTHDGTVVITSVSDAAANGSENLTVTVDGEAAAEASSYSDLRAATNGGETSKYLVRQSTSGEASADVLVAVNHFSERSITVEDAQQTDGTETTTETESTTETDAGSDETSTTGGTTTSGSGPGFGLGAALAALLAGATLLVGRR
ncbi:hypothetical protein VB773_04215 [Haloarculaceae archaeon H-GB2-1]|nr:hypothetical protein [Haloarculaceae archaeon H-GB1-1]MEA5388803.1 hypothetical protein [Haloarculaceae archaeon H-GB11]MEA5406860.1 hypothetical protein [Haloarculaceae archaeon H-GB2-1]